ncbi:patatin-like protein [Erythrobacter sp. BLCC-B19]|uniref:patatin-like protein n=1 Tax=Erythrobacter sp. BLCC-B19 TaxID=3025315 RepID=UPI00235FD0D3|nr:patatin-like protein [Erythrobacter sp. BLCC-B19]WDA40665.1 patatin-like protein [Erythrobacter sp. BLCC-B19]
MRQKELRLALVCYGGVSLAVYMHGITKEVWHLARASRAFHHPDAVHLDGVSAAYRDFLALVEREHGLRVRVLPDILTGASAGGINAVFLAQAIHAGHSLEPLTDLWLSNADVEALTDPDAEPMWRYAKLWAQPIAEWFLARPGNAVSATVSPETRAEVRAKVSRLVRGRWFNPPFSGARFSAMLYEALTKMAAEGDGVPLLPHGHPVDLAVTATDFRGHAETLQLNSPAQVEETEHRLPITFRARAGGQGADAMLGDPLELVLAARATASFPGAFPPLTLSEIDALAEAEGHHWANRGSFLARTMPTHVAQRSVDEVALIDGAVLVNAPFGAALAALHGRPAQREVDRRFVYLDPRPDGAGPTPAMRARGIGFFGAIFGSLSTIPREQPIRDDLERIAQQSQDAARIKRIVMELQGDIDRAVEKLFGYTFLLDRPTPKRLAAWRAKAQQAAAERAGYAFGAYALVKFEGILTALARLTLKAAGREGADPGPLVHALRCELEARGLSQLTDAQGGANPAAIAFFRAHDTGFRVRRLQLLARKLARDWELDPDIPEDALDRARDQLYGILALYYQPDEDVLASAHFAEIARRAVEAPGAVLDYLATSRLLPATDLAAEEMLVEALEDSPKTLKRRMLLTYLGFPFYDVATLPLSRREGLDEFNPVKIDRISPDDALSIREGGTAATLRGIEFYNFGAFFSRDYRENDYLWGRLHGAERMIDLVASTVTGAMRAEAVAAAKRAAFLAVLDEEEAAGRCQRGLVEQIRGEVRERMG